jgi:holliday junction DNA helicase RuvA
VLGANGVGPALALALLSTLSAERLVRAIRDRDVATLMTVPRVGRKKAEQMILDLADKMPADDIPLVARSSATDDAVRGLVSLGYARVDADRAVRAAIDNGGAGVAAPELIRVALRHLQR